MELRKRRLKLGKYIEKLPEDPGVYWFKNINEEIIYIGKAKNIKKRVSSYFNNSQKTHKTKTLVRYIQNIDFVIVDTEHDAFLLEDKLIKKHKPRFNISLKDNKSYPFIVIEKERFPKIYFSREPNLRPSKHHFGPYSQVKTTGELLNFITTNYKLRTCNLNLSESNIAKKKYKACLDYHLKKCAGPCVGFQSEKDYMKNIAEIRKILKGNFSKVIKPTKQLMLEMANNYEFEKAQELKEKLENIKSYQYKNTVLDSHFDQLDAISYYQMGNTLFVNYTITNEGFILHSINTHAPLTDNQNAIAKVLESKANTLIAESNTEANEIICDIGIPLEGKIITTNYQTCSNRSKLMNISKKNLNAYIAKNTKIYTKVKEDDQAKFALLKDVQETLKLPNFPSVIESFDNSHLHGKENVSAMVCFKNGTPSKKDYRLFKMKTVTKIDDFASMEEVIYRRYKRLLSEKKTLPDLILIDGGKGQLSSAIKSLETLGIRDKLTIMGIAKQKEEFFFPNDKESIILDKHHSILLFFQKIRDETHRFVIQFQRLRRTKQFIKTPLHNIFGFGEQTIRKLMTTYKSLANIKKADKKDIEKLIGKKKANLLEEFLLSYKY